MANMLAADDALFHTNKFLPDTSEDNVRQCRLHPTPTRFCCAQAGNVTEPLMNYGDPIPTQGGEPWSLMLMTASLHCSDK